jgi:hypothetical protein
MINGEQALASLAAALIHDISAITAAKRGLVASLAIDPSAVAAGKASRAGMRNVASRGPQVA